MHLLSDVAKKLKPSLVRKLAVTFFIFPATGFIPTLLKHKAPDRFGACTVWENLQSWFEERPVFSDLEFVFLVWLPNTWETVSEWLTPLHLFAVTNVMIMAIFFLSTAHLEDKSWAVGNPRIKSQPSNVPANKISWAVGNPRIKSQPSNVPANKISIQKVASAVPSQNQNVAVEAKELAVKGIKYPAEAVKTLHGSKDLVAQEVKALELAKELVLQEVKTPIKGLERSSSAGKKEHHNIKKCPKLESSATSKLIVLETVPAPITVNDDLDAFNQRVEDFIVKFKEQLRCQE